MTSATEIALEQARATDTSLKGVAKTLEEVSRLCVLEGIRAAPIDHRLLTQIATSLREVSGQNVKGLELAKAWEANCADARALATAQRAAIEAADIAISRFENMGFGAHIGFWLLMNKKKRP